MSTFQSDRRWLILLRHAEALKNIEDRHGGAGTALTETGRAQTAEVASWLSASKIDIKTAWYSNQPQVIQTLNIIQNEINIEVFYHEYLDPLDLGKLAGLSREEATRLFPKEAAQMEEWRKGHLEVQELHLHGGESPQLFYERGLKFFKEIVCPKKDSILIVTSRSVMILMISILLGRTPTPGGGYVEIPMCPCEIFSFYHDGKIWRFSNSMSSGHIKEGR